MRTLLRQPHWTNHMKPQVLQLNPILIPAINDKLASLYTVHKYFEATDHEAWLRRARRIHRCRDHRRAHRHLAGDAGTVAEPQGGGRQRRRHRRGRSRVLPRPRPARHRHPGCADRGRGRPGHRLADRCVPEPVRRRSLRARRAMGTATRSPAPSRSPAASAACAWASSAWGGWAARSRRGLRPSDARSATPTCAPMDDVAHRFVPELAATRARLRCAGAVRGGGQGRRHRRCGGARRARPARLPGQCRARPSGQRSRSGGGARRRPHCRCGPGRFRRRAPRSPGACANRTA